MDNTVSNLWNKPVAEMTIGDQVMMAVLPTAAMVGATVTISLALKAKKSVADKIQSRKTKRHLETIKAE